MCDQERPVWGAGWMNADQVDMRCGGGHSHEEETKEKMEEATAETSEEASEEATDQEFEIPVVPRENVTFPPPEDYDGVQHPVECTNPECDFFGDMGVEFGKPIEGTCPECGGELRKDFSRHMWGIDSRGPGFHSTKIGDRIKRDRIKRSEKLAVSQWDQHDPGNVVNPDRVLNATKGGPFDPNSKFNRHKKRNTKIIYPGSKGT